MMKKYLAVKENTNNITHIKIELYYDLGGANYFTGTQEDRGYYLSVTPVERRNNGNYATERYIGFTGIKQNIKKVKRKSAKAETEAENLIDVYLDNLLDFVCTKNNLKLEKKNEL